LSDSELFGEESETDDGHHKLDKSEEDVTVISRFQVRNLRHWKRTAFFVKTSSIVQRDQEACLEAVSARKKKASSLEDEDDGIVVAALLPEVVIVRFAEDRIEAVKPSRSRSIFWFWYQFEETKILVSTTLLF
jgi:hypothetical protein